MFNIFSNNIVLMIQVRVGSQRLPNKALLPIKGKTVIEHCLTSLSLVQAERFIMLTDFESKNMLKKISKKQGFDIRIGDPDDVLDRFARVASSLGVDTVIRATGDAPLVSSKLANLILHEHLYQKADLSHFIGSPLGTGVEIISFPALEAAHKEAQNTFDREHVTPFIYRNKNRFKVIEKQCPPEVAVDIDVSIDTFEDYDFVKRIYDDIYQGGPVPVEELVAWLRKF